MGDKLVYVEMTVFGRYGKAVHFLNSIIEKK